ncbi:MAG: L-histidine N(alpha)-methyltransferase [Chitinophagaceae bacterium]|nr:MAG: L-histidine N(alpha)-methyltransferase [Chitinophagaceae bacterium]
MNKKNKDSFKQGILEGLTSQPRYFNSKYFYDKSGDILFQQIMNLPEYYLTNCESEILKKQSKEIVSNIDAPDGKVNIIELGAGDGAKTQYLLDAFIKSDLKPVFIPIDISNNAIDFITKRMESKFPDLEMNPQVGEYFEGLNRLTEIEGTKLILFLGGNIGNFSAEVNNKFLKKINSFIEKGDYLFTGFDLVKNPWLIYNAYNDSKGITREFNLNLLKRLNRELQANFIVENFDHYPVYDPIEKTAKSFLVSLTDQNVYIKEYDETFYFYTGETIFTEVSRKFNLQDISVMAKKSKFREVKNFFDSKSYFCDALWKK